MVVNGKVASLISLSLSLSLFIRTSELVDALAPSFYDDDRPTDRPKIGHTHTSTATEGRQKSFFLFYGSKFFFDRITSADVRLTPSPRPSSRTIFSSLHTAFVDIFPMISVWCDSRQNTLEGHTISPACLLKLPHWLERFFFLSLSFLPPSSSSFLSCHYINMATHSHVGYVCVPSIFSSLLFSCPCGSRWWWNLRVELEVIWLGGKKRGSSLKFSFVSEKRAPVCNHTFLAWQLFEWIKKKTKRM